MLCGLGPHWKMSLEECLNMVRDALKSSQQLLLEEIGYVHTTTNVGCQVNMP